MAAKKRRYRLARSCCLTSTTDDALSTCYLHLVGRQARGLPDGRENLDQGIAMV